eukprot:m.21557 g.21557  ORF g.21557 m.21557 type:complete len:57 (+) comp28185_c0_seq1:117-287(+)
MEPEWQACRERPCRFLPAFDSLLVAPMAFFFRRTADAQCRRTTGRDLDEQVVFIDE